MQTSLTSADCLIIGSGPAGYTAAIYAGRAGISTILFEGDEPGGQLMQTTEIENFPGYPNGTTGFDMMDDLRAQAERFGTTMLAKNVVAADLSNKPYTISTADGETYTAPTIIIATGASAKYLGLPDEKKYAGRGVSACATCDGFFYKGKKVAVVGGGDTACGEAIYLAGLAERVYLVVRRNELRASHIVQARVFDCEKITVLFEHETLSLYGESKVEGARLIYRKDTPEAKEVDLPIDGFFLAIGHHPNSDVFKSFLETDEEGYIKTQGVRPLTNVDGVFASGDVADPIYRQAITAAASGCRAAIEAERYLAAINHS